MEFASRHLRMPFAAACIIATTIACGTGTEPVPVPGADAVVTAPVASIDRPAVTETEPAATDATDLVTTTAAPVVTEAPAPSTTSPAPETTAAPPATDAPVEDIYLRIGDEGPEVGLMQLKLSVLEYLPAGSDTGVFDEATQRGLRLFQSDYGLGVDGIFGPLTGRSLNAAVQSVAVET